MIFLTLCTCNVYVFSGQDPLAFLRTQPQFQQMRRVLQDNPNLLPAVLQQIAQTNPQLLEVCIDSTEIYIMKNSS